MERPKVVVTNQIHQPAIDLLRSRCEVVVNRDVEPWSCARLLEESRGAAGIMAFMSDCIDRDFIAACPHLQVIASLVKGFDNFDVDACTERGVWLTIVQDRFTAATAELTIGLMIGVGRHIAEANAHIRREEYRGWRPAFFGVSLHQRTVGILGMGAIGRAIASRLAPFGCRILGYDERPASIGAEVEFVNLHALLRDSDFVVIALPLSPATRHLINEKALKAMKAGAYLVNTARGSIVDEEAVADALEAGRLAGYAADVYEMEDWARPDKPRSISQRLLADGKRTLLTPHLGSADGSVRELAELEMARSVLDALSGRIPRGAVNRPIRNPAGVAC